MKSILEVLKDNSGHWIVDDYNIFVKCGDNYKQQFGIGDKTEYYIYKDKGYHTEAQMKSSSFIGKVLDYGMIGSYIIILCLILFGRKRFSNYIDAMTVNKNSNNC